MRDFLLLSSFVNFCTSVGVDRTAPTAGSMLDPSLPSKGFLPIGAQSVDYFDMPQPNLAGERTERLSISGGAANTSKASWKPMNHHPKLWSDLPTRPTSHSLVGSKTVINGAQHESSLFSSSLSEIFTRKCKLSFSFISIKLFLICFVWLVLPSIFSKVLLWTKYSMASLIIISIGCSIILQQCKRSCKLCFLNQKVSSISRLTSFFSTRYLTTWFNLVSTSLFVLSPINYIYFVGSTLN